MTNPTPKKPQKKVEVIQFPAQVWGIKTTVDGGVLITLALSDKQIKQIAQLLECRKNNVLLEVAAIPIKPKAKLIPKNGKSTKRTQRYPYKALAK